MEYFARNIPESGPRAPHGFPSNSEPASIYGRLRMTGSNSQRPRNSCLFPLFDVHDQLHFGMNMTAHLEGSRLRKAFGKILAGGALVGIEQSHDEYLMDEFIVVGEGQRLAMVDSDFGRTKGPTLLHDDMGIVGYSCAGQWTNGC